MKLIVAVILIQCSGFLNAGDLTQCPASLARDRYLKVYGSTCYHFTLNHPGDWKHANSDCMLHGGHLVDIQSPGEQMFLYNTLKGLGLHGDKGIWIGFNDQDRESVWKWSSGASVSYTHWANGQPGLFASNEDCALLEVSSGGTWHDYPCHGFFLNTQHHGWVCEYAMKGTTHMMSTVTSPDVKSTTTMTQFTTESTTPMVTGSSIAPTTSPTMQPMTDSTMSSMMTDSEMSTMMTDSTMSPMMTDSTMSPMNTDSTMSPMMTDSTMSAMMTDSKMSPMMTDSTGTGSSMAPMTGSTGSK